MKVSISSGVTVRGIGRDLYSQSYPNCQKHSPTDDVKDKTDKFVWMVRMIFHTTGKYIEKGENGKSALYQTIEGFDVRMQL